MSGIRGIRNNNPLNIRKGNKWKGERPTQTDPVFEEFVSVEWGFRAALCLVKNYMTGHNGSGRKLDTIDKIVRRWAPPLENATENYINFVADSSGVDRYKVIDWKWRDTICKVVRCMAFVEVGIWFDIDIIKSAYDMV